MRTANIAAARLHALAVCVTACITSFLQQHIVRSGLVAGANTLTGLIPTMYNALDIVSREMVGYIPAVTLDAQMARAAVNQTVTSPVAPASSATDITPGVTPPD